jgi:chromosome segregation ATPase
MPEPKDQNTDQGNKTTVDVLTEKIETLSKTVQERDSKIADLEKQLQESQDAREKVHGELTDALVSQFVAMRRVLDGDIPEDEAKVKELVDKLKVRSVDSLRDAITDRAPKFSDKIAEIQKGSITDHAGQVDDPTSQDTTPPPSKDGEGDGDGDKGKTGNKTGRDLL